jgi:hypothetical protein
VIDGHNDIPSFMLDLNFELGMDGGAPGTRDATLYWGRWCMNRVKNRINHPDHGFTHAPWAKLPP